MLRFLFLAVLLFANSWADFPAQNQRTKTNIVIYNDGIALIKETRKIKLQQGLNTIVFSDMPKNTISSSIFFNSECRNTKFLNHKFYSSKFDLTELTEKNYGNQINIRNSKKSGTLIGKYDNYALVGIDDNIESFKMEEIIFKGSPEFPSAGKLKIKIESPKKQEIEINITYLTKGINWSANYAILLSNTKGGFINSWLNIKNSSGVEFKNAEVKFSKSRAIIKQDTNEWRPGIPNDKIINYTLEDRVTIPKTYQITSAYIPFAQFQCTESLRVFLPFKFEERWKNPIKIIPVEKWLSIANTKANNLGKNLPSGILEIYEKQEKDFEKYGTKSMIHHTKANGIFSIPYSNAYKLFAEIYQSEYRIVTRGVVEIEYRVNIKNPRKSPIKVVVIQPIPKGKWKIIKTTFPPSEKLKQQVRWEMKIQPGLSEYLRFRFRIQDK